MKEGRNMSTAHIEAEKNDIAKKVLMPGDPLRAKYIADNFLIDVKIVNKVRNMYAYTGFYKGEKMALVIGSIKAFCKKCRALKNFSNPGIF